MEIIKNIDSNTGNIIETYPIGSKLTNNFHYILKLGDENGKVLCCRYFDKDTLMYNQSMTIFIRRNSEITTCDYGPIIESYITVVPTDDIISKIELNNIMKDENMDSVHIEDYLKK